MDSDFTELMEQLQWYSIEHPENEQAVQAIRVVELVVLTGELFNTIIEKLPIKTAKKYELYEAVQTLFAKYVNIVDGMKFQWEI
jgi:UTP-glucose-1-phosphate uridylyltransferase